MRRMRHILVSGLAGGVVTARLRSYAGLAEPGPTDATWHVINVPDSAWIVIAVPDGPHVWHFHNLAVWMLGTEADAEVPAEVATLSRSDETRWDYALYTQGSVVLRGHQGDGTPMMVHVPDGAVRRRQPVDVKFVPPRMCVSRRASPASTWMKSRQTRRQ